MTSRKIPINNGKDQDSYRPGAGAEQESFRVVDKRHFIDLPEKPVDGPAEEKPRYPTFVEELVDRLAQTERRFEERKAQIDEEIRRTRERLETDYNRRLLLEKQNILLPFLEILDNLERALTAAGPDGDPQLVRGIRLTVDLFLAKLQALSVEPIRALGEPFDPNLAQAVGSVAVDDPAMDGLVVEEVLRGYRMGEMLLRPAQVRVGSFHS